MLPSALALIIVGLIFAYFPIMVADIDMLIDAVGFLLAYNGIRALRRTNEGFFGICSKLCLSLVPIAIAQLFLLYGVPRIALLVARFIFEGLLYFALARSMGKVLAEEHPAFSILARGAFLLSCLGAITCIPLLLFSQYSIYPVFNNIVMLIFHIALLFVLFVIFLSVPVASSRAKFANYTSMRQQQRAAQQQTAPPATPAESDDSDSLDLEASLQTQAEPDDFTFPT